MALTATIYKFEIDLADADRQVYESLVLQVARHPSESQEYLVARVLAYGLEYTEGIAFSRGLFEPDEPADLRERHGPRSGGGLDPDGLRPDRAEMPSAVPPSASSSRTRTTSPDPSATAARQPAVAHVRSATATVPQMPTRSRRTTLTVPPRRLPAA